MTYLQPLDLKFATLSTSRFYCSNFEDHHLLSDVIIIIIDSFSKLQTKFLQPVLFQIQLKILTSMISL